MSLPLTEEPEIEACPVSSRPQMMHGLTALRGGAALWVIAYHFHESFAGLLPVIRWGRPFFQVGNLAVDLFFFLSGLVISHQYASRMTLRSPPELLRFLGLRLARIYPIHFVTLLATALVAGTAALFGYPLHETGYTYRLFIENLLLIHAWTPRLTLSWNFPSWSVSSEWLAYLCFPLLCAALGKLRKPGAIVAGTLLALFLVETAQGSPGASFHEVRRVLTEFLSGCFLYRLAAFLPGKPAWYAWLSVLTLSSIILVPFATPSPFTALYLLLPLAVLALSRAHFRGPAGIKAVLIYLGEISYSMYMTHSLILKLVVGGHFASRFQASALAVRVSVVVVILSAIFSLSALSYHWVELPARRFLRRRIDRQA